MRSLAVVLFLLAQPYWEAKPPEKWTDQEIESLRSDSPWALKVGPDPQVLVYLATAAPIEDAEAQARLRAKDPLPEPDADYVDYLRENRDQQLVLAIPYGTAGSWNPSDERKMEQDTAMIVGRRRHKLVGHFPPTKDDPVLRLVFPRDAAETDKSVLFRLYLPGVQFPDREAEFRIKELTYHGKLEL